MTIIPGTDTADHKGNVLVLLEEGQSSVLILKI
jgi:hypothetical protein